MKSAEKGRKHKGIDRLFIEMFWAGTKKGFPKINDGYIIDMILAAHTWAAKGNKAQNFEGSFNGRNDLNLYGSERQKVLRKAARVGSQIYEKFGGNFDLAVRLTETEFKIEECERTIARIEALETETRRLGLSRNRRIRLSKLKNAKRSNGELLLELEEEIKPAREELMADIENRLRNQKHVA